MGNFWIKDCAALQFFLDMLPVGCLIYKKNHRGGLQKWLLFFKFEIVHCAATLENSKGLLLLPCCSGLPGCNLTTRSEGFESKCHYFLNLYPR